jgi:A/G-specific adenine glycosylase
MKNDPRDQNKFFSDEIIKWYEGNGRNNLPWRNNVTAYKVWISEIMLQQTQVKTVIPFFNAFVKKYPNLKSLSLASEENILAMWTGLGFYKRAKNIFKTKEIISNNFNNRFPKSFEDIVSLPGIGPSTAGAIMSIAYKKPYPILDANVKRVISRYEAIENSPKTNKKLWFWSSQYTPQNNIFEYTQGIMDLGATICTNSNPSCNICVIKRKCKSAFKVKPIKSKNKKINPTKKINFILATSKNSVLLFKKLEKSFWEGLWTPYEIDESETAPWNKTYISKDKLNIKHKLSHIDLDLYVDIHRHDKKFKIDSNATYKWIEKKDISKYGLPKPIKSIIESL